MRIFIIISDITKTGGTERATINLSNLLCRSHEITILSLGSIGRPFFELDDKVNLIFSELEETPIRFMGKIFRFLNLYNALKLHLKHSKPDIIIGEGHNISTILPFVKNYKSLTLACEHIDYTSIPQWSRILMSISYPKLNGITVLSEIAKNKITRLNSNINVIPNSIPFEVNKTASLENNKIIMVGRFSLEKGYERLVPIAKKLKQEFPKWEINIFGNGPLKEQIQDLYIREGCINIKIRKPVSDIKKEYLDSSIHLITSYNEAMPMVILEAQYCGLPVIGFRCEGTESLIKDGVNGFIVDSEEDFYDRLQYLILEIEKRKEIGFQAKKTTEIYDSQYIKLQWENVLSHLN